MNENAAIIGLLKWILKTAAEFHWFKTHTVLSGFTTTVMVLKTVFSLIDLIDAYGGVNLFNALEYKKHF